jgi:hypothetical protein
MRFTQLKQQTTRTNPSPLVLAAKSGENFKTNERQTLNAATQLAAAAFACYLFKNQI